MHRLFVIDEIIFGGQVLETSSTEVMKAIEEMSKCLSLSLVCELAYAELSPCLIILLDFA
jgi:AP-3 complex subunit sigma